MSGWREGGYDEFVEDLETLIDSFITRSDGTEAEDIAVGFTSSIWDEIERVNNKLVPVPKAP